ncbi:hypothetical protein, partial [Streptomyces caniscabiei]|uniref:hypothetical protein n=1 Tax=Streptomyces caniscabiei TaxID=2746961 RepID=UPI001C4F8C59
MDAVRKLLTRAPASLPAVLTRAQLVGLRASLSELLAAIPEGPGAEECRGVLRELESLPGMPGAGAAVPEV